MGLPSVSQTWVMSFNNRYVWNSLTSTNVTEMGAFMFSLVGVGGFLTTTMGYTCKGSSDGTTGAMDGVNRITAPNKWATRANGSSSPISWIVLTDGAGVNWCFAYNSSSDGTIRLSHSTGGNYVAAGTPTFQPIATDECFDAASGDWLVTGGTRCDQVWHLWASLDKKMFRVVTCSQSNIPVIQTALGAFISGEKFTSALVAPATFTLGTGGGTVGATKSTYHSANGGSGNSYLFTTYFDVAYSTTLASDLCRVHAGGLDGNTQATLGGEISGGTGVQNGLWGSDYPALQGRTGYTIFPTTMAAQNAGFDGMLGTKIDMWTIIVSATSNGVVPFLTMLGNAQFWSILPGVTLVGDGATTLVAA